MTRPCMTQTLPEAARRLAAVLERENVALAAMDLPAATALLEEKTAALAALREASAESPPSPDREPEGRRLAALAADNHALLERAMVAQQRVIGIVAQAAALALEEPAYGARGQAGRAAGPVALATRV